MANERWDGDETGSGVSDGGVFAPPIRTLLDEMARPDWNTEQPEAHLLPHLERWCARDEAPLSLAPDQTTFPKGHGHLVRLRVAAA